jgi:Mlc titration factor MtfA (ptsG expression regulator)
MKVIYKIDIVFLFIYSSIILFTGIFLTVSSGKAIALILTGAAEIFYLYFAVKRPYRRLKSLRKPFPEEWRNILKKNSPFYANIDPDGKRQFEQDVRIFLDEYPIEGIRRQEIDTEKKLLIASGFATMLHGRPYWEPPIKDGVLVYPGRTFNKNYKIGKGNFAGMARANSPLIISQQSLEESFINPVDGNNVIFHEVAHYFDMEDGRAEGIPSYRLLSEKLNPWKRAITKEWEKALQGRSFLRPYAGTNEAELFAVATEFFFENPGVMKRKNPELYNLLKEFFNIDMAEVIEGS